MLEQKVSFDVEDVEYLRHGDLGLLARLYRPAAVDRGAAVIEVHGGAWSKFDRTRGRHLHEALAARGIFVMAIDFRQGADHPHPASVQDINYAIRWLKRNSDAFGVDPDRIALSGNSTGGHLAMLTAMRSSRSEYAALMLPGDLSQPDASVRAVVMLWPVINPLSRYRFAQMKCLDVEPPYWARDIVQCHDGYWRTEERMAEANPMLILDRGEPVTLPPALWIRASGDDVHDYRDPDGSFDGLEAERFVSLYQAAGGRLDLRVFDAPMMFTTVHPTLPESAAALDQIGDFVLEHTAPPRS
ncbi:alpha/beta hydrolase [Rhizorhabdus dicambivorans]|uniref:Alpha/beta hydrolase n=1 Tax=Rhizorhabdus dicambivorans TaxID=1850238 RepID=A0A2A4FXW2_9SPHN|nr:alpha/beta hydrolase [Rhizorhabdus dicambivorans]PCE42538.1 alpha/beta hydrolase [Rhizorhabdus dicambivorans]